MTKFLKITDLAGAKPAVGYHDVDDEFELPLSTKYDKYEFVSEEEARENHPALFGIAEEAEEVPAPKAKAKKVEEVK